jgi:hypothetical protein
MLQIPVKIVSLEGQVIREKLLSYPSNERLISDLSPAERQAAIKQDQISRVNAQFQAVKMAAKLGRIVKDFSFERGVLRAWAGAV